jgi:GT2 family glycosyltransferase/glycosyltransferase involved in cell wall biosynthesis
MPLTSQVTPRVSLLLVNFNGLEHLKPCLDSIDLLDWPKDFLEVLCVDNASSDGSLELLAANYPWVKVLPQETNLGFAPAVNLAAEHSTGDVLALMNNDMRVDAGWIRGLVEQYDPSAGVVCVAGTILDWEGTHLDFGDAGINFYGFGSQPSHGVPLADARIVDGAPLPFACGGAMLIQREVFLSLGGFDPKFFAYFEDVDFGWRLQVCGYRTRLAANARSFHRHHGTSSRFRVHEKMVLFERNALRILIKNASDENMPKMLASALLLASVRAAHDARSVRTDFDVTVGADDMETVHRLGNSRMHAINDIVADLPELMQLRSEIQARRQNVDAAIFTTFGDPFAPLGNDSPGYVEAMGDVARLMNIGEMFSASPVSHVVVLSSSDVIGERMAGTAIRSWELACSLVQHVRVTLASPTPVGRSHIGVDIATFETSNDLQALVDTSDAVVVFGFDLKRFEFLATTRALVIVDLYDPWIFGSLEQYDKMERSEADTQKDHEIATLNELADIGDYFLCASERQRDFWSGLLASRGRLDKAAHEQHPTLRSLIDVVPYGVPDQPPARANPPVLKGGRFPSISSESKVVLWGGGTWDWFDPLGTLEAFVQVQNRVPEARLFFMGLELEGRGVPTMASTKRLIERCHELGLIDRGLVVLGPWVPYDERGAYLLEADIGVVAAKDLAESRLAFRTRMLDHFWAGLPTLATSGDVLSELVAQRGAGIVVEPNSIEALANAMYTLLTDDTLHSEARAHSLKLADEFRWSGVVAPLAAMLREPGPWRASRARRTRVAEGAAKTGQWGPNSPGTSIVGSTATKRVNPSPREVELQTAMTALKIEYDTAIHARNETAQQLNDALARIPITRTPKVSIFGRTARKARSIVRLFRS